jgi:hypothetical protein
MTTRKKSVQCVAHSYLSQLPMLILWERRKHWVQSILYLRKVPINDFLECHLISTKSISKLQEQLGGAGVSGTR